MVPVVLATDTFSELLAQQNLYVAEHARSYFAEFGNFTISAMTYFETQKGLVYKPKPRIGQVLTGLLRDLVVVPARMEEAELDGTIHGLLKQQGRTIGEVEPIIAASAITYGLTLATSNTDHYQRIIDLGFPLQIENWRHP
jgi:predicted nucleic acid-binding protein